MIKADICKFALRFSIPLVGLMSVGVHAQPVVDLPIDEGMYYEKQYSCSMPLTEISRKPNAMTVFYRHSSFNMAVGRSFLKATFNKVTLFQGKYIVLTNKEDHGGLLLAVTLNGRKSFELLIKNVDGSRMLHWCRRTML